MFTSDVWYLCTPSGDKITRNTCSHLSQTAMPFDVFRLREHVVQEYRDYVESFVHVLDPRIDTYVRERLAEGELWPEAVLQLNPAYEPGPTLGKLAASREILDETARFFGPGLRLHRHQAEALAAARRGDNYIVSTGTGSGKSLTYLVPIFDLVLRDDPARHSVRALIVYPMNALINSQIEALNVFRAATGPSARCASRNTLARPATRCASSCCRTRRTSSSQTT